MNDDKWFLKYCKLHPIDIDIIRKLDVGALYKLAENSQLICSVNNVYVIIDTEWHSYLFRFKDMEAVNKFAEYYSSIKKTLMNNYKFDYENNETLTMINGHCLKSCIQKSILHANCINTFDDNTGLSLLDIDIENNFINNNIQTIVGELSEFKNKASWVNFKTIPAELKDLVTAQKVMLSMIGE